MRCVVDSDLWEFSKFPFPAFRFKGPGIDECIPVIGTTPRPTYTVTDSHTKAILYRGYSRETALDVYNDFNVMLVRISQNADGDYSMHGAHMESGFPTLPDHQFSCMYVGRRATPVLVPYPDTTDRCLLLTVGDADTTSNHKTTILGFSNPRILNSSSREPLYGIAAILENEGNVIGYSGGHRSRYTWKDGRMRVTPL